jgi:hypothetical protein
MQVYIQYYPNVQMQHTLEVQSFYFERSRNRMGI